MAPNLEILMGELTHFSEILFSIRIFYTTIFCWFCDVLFRINLFTRYTLLTLQSIINNVYLGLIEFICKYNLYILFSKLFITTNKAIKYLLYVITLKQM